MRSTLLTVTAVIAVTLAASGPRAAWGQGRAGASIDADIDEAQKLFDDKEWDKAIEKYQSIIAKAPQASPIPYWKLATIYLAVKKDPNAALRVCDQGERNLPDSGDIKKQRGIALLTLRRHSQAIAALEAALSAGTPPATTYDANAFLCQLQARANCSKAITACTGFLNTRPPEMAKNDLAIRLNRGLALNGCGRYQEALEDFEAVVRAAPKTATAQVGKFEALFRLGDCGRAATLGDDLNRQGQAARHPVIYFGMAKCMIEFRRANEAVNYARNYVAKAPQDLAGHILLGDAYRAKGDAYSAIGAYKQVLNRDPTNQEALTRMGDALLTTRRYTEARDIAARVLRARPDNVDAAILLARASLRLKDPKRAIEVLEKLRGKARTARVLYVLGWAYHDARDLATSVIRFDEAIRAGSREATGAVVSVRNRLAAQYLKEDKLAEAEGTLVLAQRTEPNNIITAQNLGLVRLLKGDAAGAIKALELCHQRKPTDIVVNRFLGRAYRMRRDVARAMQYYGVAEKSAERVRGPALAEVYAETATLYLEQGKLDDAVRRLETAETESRDPKITPIVRRDLAVAYLRRGMSYLKQRVTDKGLQDLQRAVERQEALHKDERAQFHCALAFALLSSGRAADSGKEFQTAAKSGGCKLKAPYDRLGVDFFVAYAKYREGGVAGVREALKLFGKMGGRAGGALAGTVKQLQRTGHEQLAVALFNRDDYRGAAAELRAARGLGARGPSLEHNLAVLDLVQGRGAQAARVLEGLGARVPEALMNLGIYFDRQGDPKKALDYYRRAYERGVRVARLRTWLDVKERLFGGK
jgi:tetratricopeptide (TPR) repeat protein